MPFFACRLPALLQPNAAALHKSVLLENFTKVWSVLNTNLAATLHSPHKSRECGLSSRSDDGCLHDAYWGDAAGQHWQVCASWLLLRLFPSAHSLARSGCRLSHFTDHISQCCSHQQSIQSTQTPSKTLSSSHRCWGFAAEVWNWPEKPVAGDKVNL